METKVYKCGGKFFVSNIVKSFFIKEADTFKKDKVVIVISAMNGITRLLRLIYIIKTEIKIDEELKKLMTTLCMNEFKRSHVEFIFELFPDEEREEVISSFDDLYDNLGKTISGYNNEENKDEFYATILQYGEIASSQILNKYTNSIGIESKWFDARNYIVTDDNAKEADILDVKSNFQQLFSESNVLISQGFIGRNSLGVNTVVGFDGSDYSAAKFSNSLVGLNDQVSLTYWKDVDGVYEENPIKNPEALLIKEMTRKDYIENTKKNNSFVVRPDSISSLSPNIEITIRSFLNFENEGTKIIN